MPGVLIVDDHVDTCRVMEKVVRHLGADAESVHSGEAALALLGREGAAPPALVLLDLTLPGMDGWQTLEGINRLPEGSRPPVVMLTAAADDGLRERALRMGAADYWVKSGFDFNDFAAMLGRFVELPKAT